MITFGFAQQNKLFSFLTRAEDNIVIVDGKCDPSMCTGRKTNEGKQVCVSVGYISALDDKCYECFGPNKGKRSYLSAAHWEETEIEKCSQIPTTVVTVGPTVPPACPTCAACQSQPGGPPSPTPTQSAEPTAIHGQLKPIKAVIINKCRYDINVARISVSHNNDAADDKQYMLEDRRVNVDLKSEESFSEAFNVNCNPHFVIFARCLSNNSFGVGGILKIKGRCVVKDETFNVNIDGGCDVCTIVNPTQAPTKSPSVTNTPVPTKTPEPTRPPEPTNTPEPSPTQPPKDGNEKKGNRIINLTNRFTRMIKIYTLTLNNNSIIDRLSKDTIKSSESQKVDISNHSSCSNTPVPIMVEYKHCDIFNICAIYESHFANRIAPCDQSSFKVNLDLN